MSAFVVVTPGHVCNPQLAIAAARAGELGLLSLGCHRDAASRRDAVRQLSEQSHHASGSWGVRWDAMGDDSRSPVEELKDFPALPWPTLLVAGLTSCPERMPVVLNEARSLATQVLVEVCSAAEAMAAEAAGFDGVIVKGHEAGGAVGQESSFLLLQQLHNKLKIPYWVQGGFGPHTAAAAFLAGAAGIVLNEQLWLTVESPFDRAQRRKWSQLDGSETVCVGNEELSFRCFSRADRRSVQDLDRALAEGCDWPATLRARLEAGVASELDPLIPLGQDIAFAKPLAVRSENVAGVLQQFRTQVTKSLQMARQQNALAPESPLAQAHGTRFPILQGPMTRVSDVASFANAVAEEGVLPFLALALMPGREVGPLLTEAKEKIGDKPWGVGILGFVPAELRKAQLDIICDIKPQFAIIAGGRPSQASQLEKLNISTYLHCPSPGLLEIFIRDGGRKFIFEGRECGGHVGPRSSFALWQSAIDVLLAVETRTPEEFQIVFAGGIHDGLSAAMVAAMAAPLVEKGMKIGVLMGTGYLFTKEAVDCGAITEEFQRQAVACEKTILLESGVGHATRCVRTPFAEEFNEAKAELIRSGKTSDEIRFELEILNIGRLRIASKGLVRESDPRDPSAKAQLVNVDPETQRQTGMYMIGQLAALRNGVVTMQELHDDVSSGGVEQLQGLCARKLPWQHLAARTKPKSDDVAIVGMACMFPKAADVRQYWHNILNKVNAVKEVPADRWNSDDFFDEDRFARDKVYSKWGGFLDEVVFDPMKWRIPPASLNSIDPIQLLALEVAWQAFQDAGYDRRPFPREKTSVIFACAGSHDVGTEYCFRTMAQHFLPKVEGISDDVRHQVLAGLAENLPEWTEDSFPGFLMNVVAGRIANRMDLGGSNYVVDAACAASLAALHAGLEQLRSKTADAVLVGAADGTNNPFCYMSFAKTHALSPRGRSRPFDDSADGISLGEGIGGVLLKRLVDAERDGDKIYAVIKGIGSSSDGKNRSMTAPHPPGQMLALERAYEDAEISPATVTLIEAHGTGTAVGDSSEITSLNQVFSAYNPDPQYAAVGSVKSMIGHTKTAAGLASLVKAALAIKHRVLPPTIGVEVPNQRVDFTKSPFYINADTRPWFDEIGHPRRAGVSAFGFGGTNFHVVLEEYLGRFHTGDDDDLTPRGAEIFIWRRRSRAEIVQAIKPLANSLREAKTQDLAQIGASIHFEETQRGPGGTSRLALVATSVSDLQAKLDQALTRLEADGDWKDPGGIFYSESEAIDAGQVCFLYPGQGSQSLNMLRDAILISPWSHDFFGRANKELATYLDQPITRFIYPPVEFDETRQQDRVRELNDTQVAQPALATVEVFATRLLKKFGLVPGCAAGHSFGEYAALQAAGCLSEESLLRIAAIRGRIAAEASRESQGAMAAVQADAATVGKALDALKLKVYLANLNSPEQTIIAGQEADLDKAVESLKSQGLRARRIPVTAAFHTPELKASAESLAAELAKIPLHKSEFTVYSNTTATPYPAEEGSVRDLLARHLVEPVQFEKEIRQMYADGGRLFVEVGPGRVLTGLTSRILKDQEHTAVSLEASGRDGVTQLAFALAAAAAVGAPVDLEAWYVGRGLSEVGTQEFLRQATAAATPKPSDWILSPARAVPVTPLPKSASKSGDALRAKFNKGKPNATEKIVVTPEIPEPMPNSSGSTAPEVKRPVVPVQPVAARPPVSSQTPPVAPATIRQPAAAPVVRNKASVLMTPERSVAPMNQMNRNELEPGPHANSELMHQYQAMMTQWLELQKIQQQVSARFLDTQERVLMSYLQGGVPESMPNLAALAPPPAANLLAAVPEQAPAPRPPATRPTAVRPPVAVTRQDVAPARIPTSVPTPAPQVKVETGMVKAQPAPAPAPVAAAPLTPVPATTDPDVPPPTEVFKGDLLLAVSERTGYPVDMLDIDLALEAGLGIDSIKTVEIFSNLKKYHACFRQEDQDEEELLVEFTKLKTLRDIIESYDKRLQSFTSGSSGSEPAAAPRITERAPETNSASSVKRFALEAVEDPLQPTGQKKNSPSITSY